MPLHRKPVLHKYTVEKMLDNSFPILRTQKQSGEEHNHVVVAVVVAVVVIIIYNYISFENGQTL